MLDLVNSLLGAFVVSEVLLHSRPVSSMRSILLGAAVLNILLSPIVAKLLAPLLAAGPTLLHQSHLLLRHAHSSATNVLHEGLGRAVGAQVLLTLGLSTVLVAFIAGSLLKRCPGETLSKRKLGMISSVVAISCYMLLGALHFQGWMVHHKEAVKGVLAMEAFIVMCYFDIRR